MPRPRTPLSRNDHADKRQPDNGGKHQPDKNIRVWKHVRHTFSVGDVLLTANGSHPPGVFVDWL